MDLLLGRSWSLARSFGGNLYSWGKGLRGQLGQGDKQGFSLSPRMIITHSTYLKIASHYAHNVGICVQKKYFNEKLLEARYHEYERRSSINTQEVEDQAEVDKTTEMSPLVGNMTNIFTYHEQFLTLAPLRSRALYEINCCRRNAIVGLVTGGGVERHRESMRFHCLSCRVDYICYCCILTCHAGHTVIPSNIMQEAKKWLSNAANIASTTSADQVPAGPFVTATSAPAGASSTSQRNGPTRSSMSLLSSPSTPVTSSGRKQIASSSSSPSSRSGKRASMVSEKVSSTAGMAKSKNPFDLIPILWTTLQYEDSPPIGFTMPQALTATTAPALQRKLHHDVLNQNICTTLSEHSLSQLFSVPSSTSSVPDTLSKTAMAAFYSSPIVASYRLQGTLLFPRKLKDRLPLNIRNLSHVLHDSSWESTVSILQERLEASPYLSYQLKFMERYPKRLPHYDSYMQEIQNRIVKIRAAVAAAAGGEIGGKSGKLKSKSSGQYQQKSGSSEQKSVSISSNPSKRANAISLPAPNKDKPSSSNVSLSSGSTITQLPMANLHSLTNLTRNLVPACQCSLYHDECNLLPTLPESSREEEDSTHQTSTTRHHKAIRTHQLPKKSTNFLKFYYPNKHLVQLEAIYKEDGKIVAKHQQILHFYTHYALKIQRLVRRYNSKCRFWRLQLTLSSIRRQVVTDYVEKQLFPAIFMKFKRVYATYREDQERQAMKYEDDLMDKYNKYKKMQKSMMAMKAMLIGVRYLVAKASIHYPVVMPSPLEASKMQSSALTSLLGEESHRLVTLHVLPPGLPAASTLKSLKEVNQVRRVLLLPPLNSPGSSSPNKTVRAQQAQEVMVPSFSFSWTSLRAQQLMLHPADRLPHDTLARLSQYYPFHQPQEGKFFDLDVYENFLNTNLQSREALYRKLSKIQKHLMEVRQTAEKAEMALKALKQKQQLQQSKVQNNKMAAGGIGGNNPGGPVGPAGLMNSRLLTNLTNKATVTLRVKLQQVHLYRELYAIYRHIFNHNFNHSLWNILHIYKHPQVRSDHFLEILKSVPFLTVFSSTSVQNFRIDYLVEDLNKAYYSYLQSLDEQGTKLLQEEDEKFLAKKSALAVGKKEEVKGKSRGLLARYSVPTSAASQIPRTADRSLMDGGDSKPGTAATVVTSRPNTSNTMATTNTAATATTGARTTATKDKKDKDTGTNPPLLLHQSTTGSAAHQAVMHALNDPHRPFPNPRINPLHRRHSIGDPCRLYNRVQSVPTILHITARLKRRQSEPCMLKQLYPQEQPISLARKVGIKASLEFFTLRHDTLKDLLKEYERYFQVEVQLSVQKLFTGTVSQKLQQQQQQQGHSHSSSPLSVGELSTHRSKGHYLWVMYRQMLPYYIPFNPRLPLDILHLLTSPNRRRTISEPERLYRTLKLVFQTRELFASIVNCTEDHFQVRRHTRSFDYGEGFEESLGLMEELDYGFNDYFMSGYLINDEIYHHPFVLDYHNREVLQGFDFESAVAGTMSTKMKSNKSQGKLSRHQRQIKIDKMNFKKDLLAIEQRMIVMRYTEASDEVVKLTKEHLAEKKRLMMMKSHFSRREKLEDGEDEAYQEVLEKLNDKMVDFEGSMKSGGSGKAGAGGKKRRRRQSIRNSFSGSAATSQEPSSTGEDDDDLSLTSGSMNGSSRNRLSARPNSTVTSISRALNSVRSNHHDLFQVNEEADEDGDDGIVSSSGMDRHDDRLVPSTSLNISDASKVEVWQIFYTDDGHMYYYHPPTQSSQWSLPEEGCYYDEYGELVYQQVESQYQDDQGVWWWYNHSTQEMRPLD